MLLLSEKLMSCCAAGKNGCLDLRRRATAFDGRVSAEWSRCPGSMARRPSDSVAENNLDWWLHIKDKLQLLCKYFCKTLKQTVKSKENKMQQNYHLIWQRLSTESHLT